ncbi:MAG: hypothetical protein ACRD4F_11240, partial [Candidatus Angelobacter sp.]
MMLYLVEVTAPDGAEVGSGDMPQIGSATSQLHVSRLPEEVAPCESLRFRHKLVAQSAHSEEVARFGRLF